MFLLKQTLLVKQEKVRSISDTIDNLRRNITKLPNLNYILLIGIISWIRGEETWGNGEGYACAKEDFPHWFLDLPNKIPSHDTFNLILHF